MEKIVTMTNVKKTEAAKFGLDMAKAMELLDCEEAPAFGKKAELPVGRFITEGEGDVAFTIYTVEERDIDAEYAGLSEKDKRIAWADGFKRKHVNAPAHIEIRSTLGLVEASTTAKKVEGGKLTTIQAMLDAGIPVDQVVRIAAGVGIPEDMVRSLVK